MHEWKHIYTNMSGDDCVLRAEAEAALAEAQAKLDTIKAIKPSKIIVDLEAKLAATEKDREELSGAVLGANARIEQLEAEAAAMHKNYHAEKDAAIALRHEFAERGRALVETEKARRALYDEVARLKGLACSDCLWKAAVDKEQFCKECDVLMPSPSPQLKPARPDAGPESVIDKLNSLYKEPKRKPRPDAVKEAILAAGFVPMEETKPTRPDAVMPGKDGRLVMVPSTEGIKKRKRGRK